MEPKGHLNNINVARIKGNAMMASSSKAILPTKKPFEPLAFPNNDPTEINHDDDLISGIVNGIAPSCQPESTQPKRPSVVVQTNPESNLILSHRQMNVKTVPGNSSYSSMASDGKTIGIFGDSMIKRLLGLRISKDVNHGKAK